MPRELDNRRLNALESLGRAASLVLTKPGADPAVDYLWLRDFNFEYVMYRDAWRARSDSPRARA